MNSSRWIEQKKMFNIETRRSHCKRQMIIVFDGVFGGILSYILDIYLIFVASLQPNHCCIWTILNEWCYERSLAVSKQFCWTVHKNIGIEQKKNICEHKKFLGAQSTQIQWLCSSNRISFYRRANIVAILMVACTCCELLVLMLVMVLWCCLCRMWIPLFMFFVIVVVVVVVGRLLVAHS